MSASEVETLQQSSDAILESLEKDPLFFTEQWTQIRHSIIALAMQNQPAVEALLDSISQIGRGLVPETLALNAYLKVEVLRYDVKAAIIREELRGASHEEIKSRLVLMALQNRQPTDVEAGEIVRALIPYDLERAFQLAQEWRWGSMPMTELVEAGWQRFPDRLFKLFHESGSGIKQAAQRWIEKILESSQQQERLVSLIALLPNCSAALLEKVLDFVEGLVASECASILDALMPALVTSLPKEEGESADAAVLKAIVRLWQVDSADVRERRLHTILAGFSITDKGQLRITRRLYRMLLSDSEGAYFAYAARARAILYYQCKVLRAFSRSDEILSVHRRQWRRFQRGERLIESLSNETLRDELIAQYRSALIEVRRAQHGAVLAALGGEA